MSQRDSELAEHWDKFQETPTFLQGLRVPVIGCDGCGVTEGPLAFVVDYGHEMRYCPPCATTYQRFQREMHMEEQRRQREFDRYQMTRRQDVALRLMPLDLPPRTRELLTLG